MNAYHIRQDATSSYHRRASHILESTLLRASSQSLTSLPIGSQMDHLGKNYRPSPMFEKALDVLFLLHADQELNPRYLGCRLLLTLALHRYIYPRILAIGSLWTSPLCSITYPTWLYTLHLFDGLNRLPCLLSLFAASPASHSGWVSVSPRWLWSGCIDTL